MIPYPKNSLTFVRAAFLSLLTLFFIAGCATVPRQPVEREVGYQEEGIASWYGGEFHGRRTANGEVYDMYGLSAAHRTLPLGTIIKVTNPQNGRSLRVRVNDRGPFIYGRVLDLSYGAASRLDIIGPGTAWVRIEVVELAGSAVRSAYTVQVGAFAMQENALRLKKTLATRYQSIVIQRFETNSQQFYRVRVGRYSSQVTAERVARELASNTALETFVTRQDP
jgi:rare lipoprotein A